MEEAGRDEGVQNQIFIDFGSILGFYFNAFWALRLEISILFRLVSRSLIARTFSVEIWTPGVLKADSYSQKHIFTDSSTGPMTADKQMVSEIHSHGAPANALCVCWSDDAHVVDRSNNSPCILVISSTEVCTESNKREREKSVPDKFVVLASGAWPHVFS